MFKRRLIHGLLFFNYAPLWFVFVFTVLVCLLVDINDDFEPRKAGKTSTWQWPVCLDFYKANHKIYFALEDAIATLGIKQEISHRGYTRIDKFLKEQGKSRLQFIT